jgi:cyclopropane-fatty-acyl-phospholipid synthase
MATQTLYHPARFRLPSDIPGHGRHRPFLEALQHIEYGRLTLVTPEGETFAFAGPQPGPAAHLKLHDWQALGDLVARGEIGFAEAYIEERWSSADMPALLTFGLINSPSLEHFFHGRPWYALWLRLSHLLHANSKEGSRRNVMAHYDLGNDFYKLWLDESMSYSCALFEGNTSRSLEAAQAAKYQRVLRTIAAAPGDHILEIGCGWGAFAEVAARRKIRVTAITLSKEQAHYARQRLYRAGLHHMVSVQLADYREVAGSFDHIVSIGMFEHVGERYWPTYFKTLKERLRPGGRALIQSIMLDDFLFESLRGHTGFIEQYIFPGGMLPSKSRFYATAAKAGLSCPEMYAFGQDYVLTVRHWLTRFEAHTDKIRALGYDEAFIRLWRFYLASCIASFASRRTDVVQAALVHAN